MQLGEGVEVITISDAGLWALNKPAGTLSHPNKPGEESYSLINAPYDMKEEAYMTDEGPYFLLHRLDGPTSGVILVTPYERVASQVKEMLKTRKVKKIYNAIVAGVPSPEKALWRDKLTKRRHNEGGVRGVVGGGAPAESQMYVLKKFEKPLPSALLELQPLTGRTHQLRIQCAQRRTPIIGDATYGDFALNRELKAKHLMLHARAVMIEEFGFYAEAELPKHFLKWGK